MMNKRILSGVICLSGLFIAVITLSRCTYERATDKHLSERIALANNMRADSIKKDSILYAKIWALPEVKRKFSIIDSSTDHKQKLSIDIIQRPTVYNPYYIVRIGHNHDRNYETFYNFYVYPDNWEIKYLDVVTNKPISLKEWRKGKNG